MPAMRVARALLLPLWAGAGACSLVVDTSPIDAEGCGSLQVSCDGICRYLTDEGYGCGACQVCEFESVQGEPTGYATFECVSKTSTSGSNMPPEASMGSSSKYGCENPTCLDGFHGDRCQYPKNDFAGYSCPSQGCPVGNTCQRVRPGVEVCL